MAVFRYPVPDESPLVNIVPWRALLLAAVEEALDYPDTWEEGKEDLAMGYVEDLKAWIADLT